MKKNYNSINWLLVAFMIGASSINASSDDKVSNQEVTLRDLMSAVGVSVQKVGVSLEPATRLYNNRKRKLN